MAQADVSARSQGPHVRAAWTGSVRMLRERPLLSLALGGAVGLSMLSVCCGLGLLTTPWFICELAALQLALSTGKAIERGPAFLVAGWLLFWLVLTLGAVLAISLLGAGSALSLRSADTIAQGGAIAALLGSGAAWLLLTPLLFAPLVVLERRASSELALADSARLMMAGSGLATSARLGLSVFFVQYLPLALGAWLVSLYPGRAALWLACTAPLVCVSVPLGQGMLTSAYVQATQRVEPLAPRPLAVPVRRWVRIWAALIALPIAALVLLELSLSRPSRLAQGSAPKGEVLLVLQPSVRVDTAELPSTALTLRASTDQVSVAASDGGGVGELPLSAAEPIDRVRVVRVRDTFYIELLQGEHTYLTRIDRAGVRLDDDLRARLHDRSRPWQWLALLATLLVTGVLSVFVLYDLGRSQQPTDRPVRTAHDPEHALRRARMLALLLAPLGLGCLTMALRALFAG